MSLAAAGEPQGGFAPAAVVAIAIVAFVGFLAFMGLGAYEPQFRRGADGGAHAQSKSAVGFTGLAELLSHTGRGGEIVHDERAYPAVEEPGVVVLTIPAWGDPSTPLLDLPTTRGFDGSILAILPKWATIPEPHHGWVRKVETLEVETDAWLGPTSGKEKIELLATPGKQKHTLKVMDEGEQLSTIATGEIDRLQVFSHWPGWTPVVVDEAGRMVLGYANESALYAVSDPDLLNNHGIADLVTAKAGMTLLDEVGYGGPVYLDITLPGLANSRSPIRLMLEPPFLAATICVLGAALLMFWHSVFRFGAPRLVSMREFALGKQALADNQAGLIRMARREPRMGGRYAQLIAALVIKAVGAPKNLPADQAETYLDRLADGRTAERISTLREAAEKSADRKQLMDAAQRLHRWKREMTREGI